MRYSPYIIFVLSGAPVFGAPAPIDTVTWTQNTSEVASEEAPPQEAFEPPPDVEAAVALIEELGDLVAGLDDDGALALLRTYLELADQQRTRLLEVASAVLGSPEGERAPKLRADLGTLTSAAERVSTLLAKRGLDVTFAQRELRALREMESSMAGDMESPKTREAALAIDIEVLRANLRPLTKDEVQERLATWMALLKETCLEVRDDEVASLTAAPEEGGLRFQERAVLLRQKRTQLIGRVKVVISAVKEKGGDVSEADAYLGSVVAVPPITGFKAAMTTAVTWIKSPGGGLAVGVNIVTALLILLASLAASRLLGRITRRAIGSVHKTSGLLREFVVMTVRRGALIVGVLIALSTLGVNMGPLLAAIGAAGLVVGLALQGTLGNLASGLMIMVFRPFDVEDIVETGGASGKVLGMSLMTTTIRTFDNRTVFVPNSIIWGDVITNVTANSTRRIDLMFGIAYEDDADLAREVLEGILNSNDKVLDDPAPIVRLHELGDSSVNFIARPWSKTADYWDVYWEITAAVKAEFDAKGISIPYPQRDLHIIAPKDPNDDPSRLRRRPEATEETSEAQQEVPADA